MLIFKNYHLEKNLYLYFEGLGRKFIFKKARGIKHKIYPSSDFFTGIISNSKNFKGFFNKSSSLGIYMGYANIIIPYITLLNRNLLKLISLFNLIGSRIILMISDH